MLSNKWFHAGNLVINLDWIAWVKFNVEETNGKVQLTGASIHMAAGKRKNKKIDMDAPDAKRLKEIFKPLEHDGK